MIKATDKVGARRVILNLIPEAGPYVNQAVDYLIKAQEKGVIDDFFNYWFNHFLSCIFNKFLDFMEYVLDSLKLTHV